MGGAPADRHKCKLLSCSCFKPKLSTVPAPHHIHLPVTHMRVGSACRTGPPAPGPFSRPKAPAPCRCACLPLGTVPYSAPTPSSGSGSDHSPARPRLLSFLLPIRGKTRRCTASLVTAQVPSPGTSHSGTLSTLPYPEQSRGAGTACCGTCPSTCQRLLPPAPVLSSPATCHSWRSPCLQAHAHFTSVVAPSAQLCPASPVPLRAGTPDTTPLLLPAG